MSRLPARLSLTVAILLAAPCGAIDLEPGGLAESHRLIFDREAEERGMRAGPFDLRAAAAVSLGYDSNADAIANPETGAKWVVP